VSTGHIAEATKNLNRAYSLVRAAYGPKGCRPSVRDFVVRIENVPEKEAEPAHAQSTTSPQPLLKT
jgi:hypothetical protein